MRKLEQKKIAFGRWMKKVIERRNIVKSYMAATHHRTVLLFKSYYALKKAPIRSQACRKLRDIFLQGAIRPAFNELLKLSQD